MYKHDFLRALKQQQNGHLIPSLNRFEMALLPPYVCRRICAVKQMAQRARNNNNNNKSREEKIMKREKILYTFAAANIMAINVTIIIWITLNCTGCWINRFVSFSHSPIHSGIGWISIVSNLFPAIWISDMIFEHFLVIEASVIYIVALRRNLVHLLQIVKR